MMSFGSYILMSILDDLTEMLNYKLCGNSGKYKLLICS